jgi:short subunit dehydrogenase-like uncharacterized protein
MPGRIVLFGATGYMGELTARALAARGARPVLAGRDAQRLETLAKQLGRLGHGLHAGQDGTRLMPSMRESR